MAVDGSGAVVDGDQVLGVLALERLARPGADPADPAIGTLVVSVLSNGGLQQAVEAAGGTVVGRRSGTSTSSRACRCPAPGSAARRAAT